MSITEAQAEWCDVSANIFICGTRMKEHSRNSLGDKWCFQCRKRVEFELVVMMPDGDSYYGPSASIDCTNCGAIDGDLFPGWNRDWPDD